MCWCRCRLAGGKGATGPVGLAGDREFVAGLPGLDGQPGHQGQSGKVSGCECETAHLTRLGIWCGRGLFWGQSVKHTAVHIEAMGL